eukprot:c56400_g1_i1 orf=55-252(+)
MISIVAERSNGCHFCWAAGSDEPGSAPDPLMTFHKSARCSSMSMLQQHLYANLPQQIIRSRELAN